MLSRTCTNELSVVWSWGWLYCKFVTLCIFICFFHNAVSSPTGHTVYIQCQAVCILEAVLFIWLSCKKRFYSWFQTFTMFGMLYSFFWVICVWILCTVSSIFVSIVSRKNNQDEIVGILIQDHQYQQITHLTCIHTLHPDNIWPTQQNAGKTQYQNCCSTTKENLQLPTTCQGCFGIKNAGCIQHPMWMWQGLYWTKW